MTLATNLMAMYYQQSVGGGRPPFPPAPAIPSDEIWYYAASQVTLYSQTGVVSHTFSSGRGVIKFGSPVTSVGDTLRGTAITDVKFPAGVTAIGSNAFYRCTSLALSALPPALTSIGGSAFASCSSLAISAIPASVESIGGYAFSSTGLSSITFLGTPASINSTAFSLNSGLLDIYVPWSSGAVANAPWGASKATTHYNYTPTT